MPWHKLGATHYHALPDKSPAITGLFSFSVWELESLELLNGLALGCYQPSPEIFFEAVLKKNKVLDKINLLFFEEKIFLKNFLVLSLISISDH